MEARSERPDRAPTSSRRVSSWVLALGVAGWACADPAALDWRPEPFGRSAPLLAPATGRPGFSKLAPEVTGISLTNFLAQSRHLTNQILLNGSGVALGDVDGDGWCDIYLCGLDGPNALYRNLGHWRFTNITESAGVACPELDATGAAFADLDGDGDLDLAVNSMGGGTQVFLNDGKGHFARAAVLNEGKGGTSLAFGDLDGDGFLDLYAANYRTTALMDAGNAMFDLKVVNGRQVVERVNGRPVTDPDLTNRYVITPQRSLIELGEPDALFHNQGGTNFVPVSFTDGTFLDADGQPLATPPFDWGLTVAIRDINGDGLPDIYVCNDFETTDKVWINLGRGRFRELPRLSLRKSSLFSMCVDFADINRDGRLDFLTLDMLSRDHVLRMVQMGDQTPPLPRVGEYANRPQYMLTLLLLNRGDGTYAEIGQLAGVQASEWAWAGLFLDVDLDGWEDLLICNGNERDGRNLDVAEQLRRLRVQKKPTNAELLQARTAFPRLATANLAFRNQRDLRFAEVGKEWGFDYAGVSNGMALGDLDNDGDLDVVVNHLNDAAGVYRNEVAAPRVAVRLRGCGGNRFGVGAKVTVRGGPVEQSQEIMSGGRYLSGDEPVRVFAAGVAANGLEIEVRWRGGRVSRATGLAANRVYEFWEERADAAAEPPSRAEPAPWFAEATGLLGGHRHADQAFDERVRQPLLPRGLSQLGPGVGWVDVDGDGWDDLVVGGGKGGRLAVFRNTGSGGFARMPRPAWEAALTRDQAGLAAWWVEGGVRILAGLANYEDGLAAGPQVRGFGASVEELVPATEGSAGPLAVADYDGDGHLDLLVGARGWAARYPEGNGARLYRWREGGFQWDEANTAVLARAGMVSGAVWTDVDGDGDVDLALACDWGPVRLFRNDQGRLVETTETVGLGRYVGWWNGITAGDVDGDGRMDLVAANWGRNSRYEAHRRRPLVLYYGDVDGDGVVEVVEGYYDEAMGREVPERGLDVLGKAMPWLRERFKTHRAYGEASLQEVLGERAAAMKRLEANGLESMVFLNRGTAFEAVELPIEAQFAPSFGVEVGDLDGDGREDVFLSQNFFEVVAETARYDGGVGVCLLGEGQGRFRALRPGESGVRIDGEGRGATLGDYDGDGRLDLVVAQNGAETKLFHNERGRPGLRVRLRGPPGNPVAVGAMVRIGEGQAWGPAREITAGAGYWSQRSVVPVMTFAGQATRVWVRWPGGRTTTSPIPEGAREIAVSPNGETTRLR